MSPLLDAYRQHVAHRPSAPCWLYKDGNGRWRTVTWAMVEDKVRLAAEWLIARGVSPGEAVALWSSTRMEWTLWDLAIISVGAVTVPIYPSLPIAQAAFIVNEPRCRVLILERAYRPDLIGEIAAASPQLEDILLLEGSASVSRPAAYSFADLLAHPPAATDLLTSRRGDLRPETLASIVYTSGTTGTPKGVELTHGNFMAEVEGLRQAFPISPDMVGLQFLPLAHIVARAMQMFQLAQGWVGAYAEGLDKVAENIREVRPNFFVAVPRLYEKIYQRVQEQMAAAPRWKRALARWAEDVGDRLSRARRLRQPIPIRTRLAAPFACAVFAPLRRRLGGRLKFAISGGAPLSKELARFFHAVGVPLLEGYGLTETTAAVTVNRLNDCHTGTVGKQLAGVQVRLAKDGEILIKGPVVMRGYFKRPDETREVLDAEGWLATGDIGAFSRDGFLRVTDRKKDLIKTAGGKYIAPQPIEARLKTHPLIADVVLYGDRRRYLTALITLNREALARYISQVDPAAADARVFVTDPRVRELVQSIVEATNKELASFETIKRFALLDHDFTLDSGELTPTLKVKRQVAYERYREEIEAMYRE